MCLNCFVERFLYHGFIHEFDLLIGDGNIMFLSIVKEAVVSLLITDSNILSLKRAIVSVKYLDMCLADKEYPISLAGTLSSICSDWML